MAKKPLLFEKIVIVGRQMTPTLAKPIAALAAFLAHRGHKVALLDETAAMTGLARAYLQVAPDEIAAHDLLISIGGDGTMLSAARAVLTSPIPIIGVNQGRLGFLTDIPQMDMEALIGDMLDGHYVKEERSMLNAVIERGDGPPITIDALNDIAINRGITSTIAEFFVAIDGVSAYTLRADGLIIATPTGSTAYALSAGGPILSPALSAFVLVPVAPYGLTHRPVVLPDTVTMTITVKGTNSASLHGDSQTQAELREGDVVTVTKSPHTLHLLHPVHYDYFSVLREKLHWSKMPERFSREKPPFSQDDDQE